MEATDGYQLDGENNRHDVRRRRALTGNVAEVVRDVTELAELQVRLLAADSRSAVRRAAPPLLACAGGIGLGLGSLPVALMALGYVLHEQLGWSLPVSFATVAGGALMIASALVTAGWGSIGRSVHELDRSRNELAQNIAWVKRAVSS